MFLYSSSKLIIFEPWHSITQNIRFRLLIHFRTNLLKYLIILIMNCNSKILNFRSSHPEVLLEEGVLKICSKFTREHPYCKATLLKSHFGMGVLLQICCIFSEHLRVAAFGKCIRFSYYYIIAYYVIITLIIIMLLLSTKYITTLTKFVVVCSLIITNFLQHLLI